ncbi:MAG: ABC transporter ATP-binding protein, partial [Lachnospiraceae bacterium]|nr:ABC transporter ATP-binding protein [Lachnospiraceae bacterium]
MIKILKHMKAKEWILFGFGMIFVFAQVWLDLKIPDYMSDITVLVKSEEGDIGKLLAMGGMMMLCAVGSLAALILAGYFSSRLAAVFSRRLRREVFEKVEQFSLEEIDHFSTASLITRSTNDVEQLQRFVSNGLRQMLQAPMTAILALIMINGQQWEWSVVTAGAVVIVVATIGFVISYAQPRFRRMQTLTDNLNRAMRENMTGIRVVRAYNAEEFQEKKFDDANDRYMHNALEANRAQSVMHPVMQLANNGLTIAIYCIGAFLIAGTAGYSAQLEIFSEMLVFTTYAAKLLSSFMSLNMIFNMMPRASVSVDRINEILDTYLSIQDGEKTTGKAEEKGEIEFRNVSFHYPDSGENVLTDISFKAHHGETVAFIGSTGSGKTTLMNLVPRFYDATGGEILVDGVNVKEYTPGALRSKQGMAPHTAVRSTVTD